MAAFVNRVVDQFQRETGASVEQSARDALIRPAWDRSERFRPALLTSKDGPQERHRAYDTALLEACAAHDPEAAAGALHDHLALASVIFHHELGGRGIFDPR